MTIKDLSLFEINSLDSEMDSTVDVTKDYINRAEYFLDLHLKDRKPAIKINSLEFT